MPKRTGNVTRDILVKASLPTATDTYTVISHGFVINTIMQSLSDNGFVVKDELYKSTTNNAQVASGVFRLDYGDDPDMGMMFAFANSYDKSLKFRCAVGGYVYANEGSIISHRTNQWGRKHTGTADEETATVITDQINQAASYFETLVEAKEAMKNIEITENEYAKLLGVLYFEKKLLSGEQLGIIKREYAKPSYTYTTTDDSLWTLYNHILVSLKRCHPRTWFDQQRLIHYFMVTEYDLANFDVTPGTLVDPALENAANEEADDMKVDQILNEKEEEDDTKRVDFREDLINEEERTVTEYLSDDDEETYSEQEAKIQEEENAKKVASSESEDSSVFMEKDTLDLFKVKGIGDSFEIDGIVYEVAVKVEDGFKCIPQDQCGDVQEPPCDEENDIKVDKVEAAIETAKAVLPVPPVVEREEIKTTEVEFDTTSTLDEVEVVEEAVDENFSLEQEGGEEEADEEWEANTDDPIYMKISEELEDLYGETVEFKYTLDDGQYNITLKTGETVVLIEEYVDTL